MIGRLKHGGGGSASNAAVNASKLKLKTGIIGKVGFDEYGWFLIQNFRSHRVNVDHVIVDLKKPTGVSLIIVNEEGTPQFIQMVGASEPVSSGEIHAAYIQEAQHLHMTGINLEILETASRVAKESGKTVSFDPGRKKSELGYRKLAPVLRNIDYLLINRREARVLLGARADDLDILEVMSRLRRRIDEDKTYVVKGGSEDILVSSPEGNFSVSPFKVKVVDTIGAGDAFDAGFLTALIKGRDLADAVVYGAACGSLKCTRESAQSTPDKLELEGFLRENSDTVRMTKLPW